MSPETTTVIGVIIEVIIAILVILTPIGIIGGIVLLATNSDNNPNKKRQKTWGIITILAPFILLFIILSLWGLVRILSNTF